jgi:hypothetical protein
MGVRRSNVSEDHSSLTLILFMAEAVKAEFGEETMKSVENDLREAYRKLPSLEKKAN